MKIQLILFLAPLLVLANNAFAQCQAGIVTPNCVPYEYWPGASGNNSPRGVPQEPVYTQPQPIWQDRWGAIAVDWHKEEWYGYVYTSNRTSKSDAEKRVLNGCQERGGKDCRVLISYYNQCVAYSESYDGNTYTAGRGGDVETARKVALKECQDHGGSRCEVLYEECSYPVRIN